MKPSKQTLAILAAIGTGLASPSTFDAIVSDAADARPAADLSSTAFASLQAKALADLEAMQEVKDPAKVALSKATAATRSLGLAILAMATGTAPDVRAAHGWNVLLACPTREDLQKAVSHQIATLDSLAISAGEDAGNGPDAERRSGGGTLYTSTPTPKPHQQARRLALEALALALEATLAKTPSDTAKAVAGKLATRQKADAKRKAA